MSIIFPIQPAKVHVHPLPSAANFISYRNSGDALALKAWMPSGIATFKYYDKRSRNSINEQFNMYHCRKCPRGTMRYYRETYPEDYYVDDDFYPRLYRDGLECSVPYYGYKGQHCPLGKTVEEIKWDPDQIVSISDTTIEIYLTRSLSVSTTAGLTGSATLRSGEVRDCLIYRTDEFRSGNCYDEGTICWGNNTYPETLREMVDTYLYSRFNHDLTGLDRYKKNCEKLEELKKDKSNYRPTSYDKFLCQGYNNLMIINGEEDVQAFFTMTMAGYEPIPELSQYMLIPMDTCTIAKDDNYYLGYKTEPDAVGRSWYVSAEGFLIGQLDESYSYA